MSMGLVVVGAAGRMGRTLIRAIHETPGAALAGAVERAGSPLLGQDAGEVAGVGRLGVAIADDPLPVFARAEGVLDFTVPAATVEFAGYAAQARIAHVIGTTGCTAADEERIAAAARHATIGDIRGAGLFLGVEMVTDPESRTPAPELAAAVVNGLRARRVLISASGPAGNVLKIRPPLVFSPENADLFLETLGAVMGKLS